MLHGIWVKLKVLGNFIQLVKEPTKTEKIFAMVRSVSHEKDHPAAQMVFEHVSAQPKFKGMLERREMPRMPSPDSISRMPPGSLGHALHRHMTENHLSWGLFPRFEGGNDIEYFSARVYQVHDIWHTLLGYGVSVGDELALQAFGIAQYRSVVSAILVAGGLLHTILFKPTDLILNFELGVEGYLRGKKATFLLDLPLEEMLERPLAEVQALCGIEPRETSAPVLPAYSVSSSSLSS